MKQLEIATRTEQVHKLFQSWREGDAREQKETWEYLKRVLDEDRSSDRKLFPNKHERQPDPAN